MRPDQEAWFRKGDEDLLAIENNLAASRVPWSVMCFHAQQLAEKYLKGFLVFHRVLPPKTHDLERLLALAVKHDGTLSFLQEDCSRLTETGLRSRYPGAPDEADEAEGRGAIGAARRVRDAIRERVPAGSDA